jgi:hypothetical protein
MYYLTVVINNSMEAHLTSSDWEGFKKCCISNAMDATDDYMLWNGCERRGMLKN